MQSERIIKDNRSEVLDIAKGIGILLVVWAHASGPFSNYINQFHMPFFFLISGYLYSKKSGVKDFVLKKTKSLYIPFIFWNILGGTIIALLGLLDYNFWSFTKHLLLIILTVDKDGALFGATWFLGSLFSISILYKSCDYLLRKRKHSTLYLLFLFVILGIIGFNITFPLKINRTLILSLFYAIGFTLRRYKAKLMVYDKSILVVICLILYVFIVEHNVVSMGNNSYSHKYLFFIGALCGSYVIIYFSKELRRFTYIKKIFTFLGKHSIDIVIWQFIVFRPVILVQIILNDLSLKDIFHYYPVYSSDNGWWLIYTLFGTFGSIFIGWLLRRSIWGKLLKKTYIV